MGGYNSALARALKSLKLGISIVHIEASARCYDMWMTEGVNEAYIQLLKAAFHTDPKLF